MMGAEIQSEKEPLKPNTKKIISKWALDFALNFLIKQGINPNRLSASGYGSFQPIDKKNTKSARMKNRRIEMKITQNTKIK